MDLGEVYKANRPVLLSFAQRTLATYGMGKAGEAEDVLHQAVLNALRAQHTFRGDASPLTWLRNIVRNECYTLGRRLKPKGILASESELDSLPALQPSQEAQLLEDERSERVQKAVSRLSEKERTALERQYWDEMSYDEQAVVEGLPVSTVKTRAQRGRVHLRTQLAGVV